MHGKYFFLALALILVLSYPVAGSLTKITAGAPVYIGEQNLDISAGLQGCRVIDWWEAGADTTAAYQKNVTIIKTLDDSDIAFSYTISPEIYNGYDGTWYCEGQRPLRPVFTTLKPQIKVRFWDLDNGQDVTGKTIPATANITYRVDTNLDTALQLKYRPDMTALDSFYTFTLTDPGKKSLLSIYTGSYGKADTHALIFDKKPIITISPYYWKDGSAWDRTSRNIQGDYIYSEGTYSITVNQDLNHMQELYANTSLGERAGMLESSATVTFTRPKATAVQTVSAPVSVSSDTLTSPLPVSPPVIGTENTISPTLYTAPLKTTYAPLPLWIVLIALGITLTFAVRRRT